MSGPAIINNSREMASGTFEDIENLVGAKGWEFFAEQWLPAGTVDILNPDDELKMFIAAMSESGLGKRFFDYLMNLTVRHPYPMTTNSMEDLAFAAAKHQARATVGELLVKIRMEGRALNATKGPKS